MLCQLTAPDVYSQSDHQLLLFSTAPRSKLRLAYMSNTDSRLFIPRPTTTTPPPKIPFTSIPIFLFSSVYDNPLVLRKTYFICTSSHLSTVSPVLSLKQFPSFRLTSMLLSCHFKVDHRPPPFLPCLLQAVNGVMSLAVFLQIVPQAPYYFRSSEIKRCSLLVPNSLWATL